MELELTKKLLCEKIENEDFDSYAVLIHCGKEEVVLFSNNVDEYTYFDIASMGKVLITSTLVIQAIDKGLLKLESTLDEFFKDVPDEKKNITVKQLLTHTSGIVRHRITNQAVCGGHEEIAREMMSHPLRYIPGTDYIYSCNGFILLGYILEKIYNMPLEEIYNINIAKPLGLQRTAFEIGFDEPNSVVCYRCLRDEKMLKRFDDENVQVMGETAGSGGQQSCLHDIKKFIEAVISKNERIYSEEWFELAEKNYTPDYSEGRGLGYLVVDEKYRQTGKLFPIGSFGHCGHTGQSFFINREKNLYVILLTNATRFASKKNDFKEYHYSDIMKLREEIHNAIDFDLKFNTKS